MREELHRCKGGASLFGLERIVALIGDCESPMVLETRGFDLADIRKRTQRGRKRGERDGGIRRDNGGRGPITGKRTALHPLRAGRLFWVASAVSAAVAVTLGGDIDLSGRQSPTAASGMGARRRWCWRWFPRAWR